MENAKVDFIEEAEAKPVETELAEIEGYVPQDKVNKLVGGAKAAGYAKAKREMEQQMHDLETQASNPVGSDALGAQHSLGAATPEMIARIVSEQVAKEREAERAASLAEQERLQREEYEMQVHQFAGRYVEKLNKGRAKYGDDFEAAMKEFDPLEFKDIAFIASNMENGEDILLELIKNPNKLANIAAIADRSPKLAEKQMRALGDSIIKNEEALKNNVSVHQPLTTARPSTSAGSDSGPMSVRDFKKIFR